MNVRARPESESRAGWGLIAGTLFLAWLLRLPPLEGWLLWLRPDTLLIVLFIWVLKRPSRVGMGLAWPLGLLTDFQEGVVLGQYALAYTVAVYVLLVVRRRMALFSYVQQAAHIFVALVVAQCVVLVAGWVSGHALQHGWVVLSVVTGTLLWWALARWVRVPIARNLAERKH
jgi:rod shape-determining protein MreD